MNLPIVCKYLIGSDGAVNSVNEFKPSLCWINRDKLLISSSDKCMRSINIPFTFL